MTDTPTPAPAPMTAERLKHIRENYQRLGEAALERHCGDLLAHIDALTAELAAARKVEDGEVEEALGWLDKPQLYPSGRIKKIAALVRQLYAALKEAERRETEAKTLQHQLASDLTVAAARAQAAEAENKRMREALEAIPELIADQADHDVLAVVWTALQPQGEK